MAGRAPGHRAGLTREGVISAANELVAERGVRGITMRSLAGALGVAPNALYSHIRGKDDVIDTLLDDALAAVQVADPTDGRHGVETIMVGTYDALLARGGLISAYLSRRGARGPHAIDLGHALTAALIVAGVEASHARSVQHTLVVTAIGFAAYDANAPDPTAARAGFLAALGLLLDGATSHRRHAS